MQESQTIVSNNIYALNVLGLYDNDTDHSLNIKVPSMSSNVDIVFPNNYGIADQVLATDGAGNLYWSTGGAGGGNVTGPVSSTDNAISIYNGVTGKIIKNSLVTIDSSGNIFTPGYLFTKTSIKMEDQNSKTVTLQSNTSLTNDYTLTFPADAGATGQVLSTDGIGNLSWKNITGGGNVVGPNSSTNNAVSRFDGVSGSVIENSLLTVDDAGNTDTPGYIKSITSLKTGTVSLNPPLTGGNYTLTFPTSTGTNGQVLTTDGTGNLSWDSGQGGGNVIGPNSSTDMAVALFLGDTGKILQNSTLLYSSDNLLIPGYVKTDTALVMKSDGSQNTTIQSAPSLIQNITFTMPNTTGTSDQVLTTDGSGALSWSDKGGPGNGDVTGPSSSINSGIALFNGVTGKIIKSSGITVDGADNTIIPGYVKTKTALYLEDPGVSIQSVALEAPTPLIVGYTLTLPTDTGTNDQVLTTDGTGILSWTDKGGIHGGGDVVGPSSSTDNGIALFNGTTGKLLQNSNVTISSDNMIVPGYIRTENILQMAVGSYNLSLKAPSTLSSNIEFTYPNNTGTNGQVLTTNGSGVLSWSTPAITGNVIGPDTATDRAIAIYNGSSGKAIQNTGVIIDENNNLATTGSLQSSTSLKLPNGSGAISLQSPTLTTDVTLTLPPNTGTSNQVLTTDGTGVMTWTSIDGDVNGPGSSTDNALARFDGTTGKLIQNSNAILDDTGNLQLEGYIKTNKNIVFEDPGIGTNTITISAPTPLIENLNVTLPGNNGISGQFLSTDGNGVTSWNDGGDVTGPSSSGNGRVALFDGITGKLLKEDSNVFVNTSGTLNASSLISSTNVQAGNGGSLQLQSVSGLNLSHSAGLMTSGYNLVWPTEIPSEGEVLNIESVNTSTSTATMNWKSTSISFNSSQQTGTTVTYNYTPDEIMGGTFTRYNIDELTLDSFPTETEIITRLEKYGPSTTYLGCSWKWTLVNMNSTAELFLQSKPAGASGDGPTPLNFTYDLLFRNNGYATFYFFVAKDNTDTTKVYVYMMNSENVVPGQS